MRINLERNPGARFLLIAAALVVVVFGVQSARAILLPFLIALFLAVLNLPLLHWLRARKLPLLAAVLLTMLVNGVFFAFLALVVSRSLEDFIVTVPRYTAVLQEMAEAGVESLRERGVPVSELLVTNLINDAGIINVLGGALRNVASVLANAFLILIIMIFMLLEATAFPNKLRRAFGQDVDISHWTKITREVQRYLGIKTLISLATGSLVGCWVWFLDVDFPLLWGLVAFLMNYIPNIGSVLAAIPPVLLAFVQFGLWRAVAMVFGYLAVNMALGNFLEPTVMGRKLGLSALIVVLSLVFWGWVLGPIGMLLAVPLTMIVKITLENTQDFRWLAVFLGGGTEPTPAPAAAQAEQLPARATATAERTA